MRQLAINLALVAGSLFACLLMLLDLLIDASLAAPDTLFARLLRWIDRSLLIMVEQDARAESDAAQGPPDPGVW